MYIKSKADNSPIKKKYEKGSIPKFIINKTLEINKKNKVKKLVCALFELDTKSNNHHINNKNRNSIENRFTKSKLLFLIIK